MLDKDIQEVLHDLKYRVADEMGIPVLMMDDEQVNRDLNNPNSLLYKEYCLLCALIEFENRLFQERFEQTQRELEEIELEMEAYFASRRRGAGYSDDEVIDYSVEGFIDEDSERNAIRREKAIHETKETLLFAISRDYELRNQLAQEVIKMTSEKREVYHSGFVTRTAYLREAVEKLDPKDNSEGNVFLRDLLEHNEELIANPEIQKTREIKALEYRRKGIEDLNRELREENKIEVPQISEAKAAQINLLHDELRNAANSFALRNYAKVPESHPVFSLELEEKQALKKIDQNHHSRMDEIKHEIEENYQVIMENKQKLEALTGSQLKSDFSGYERDNEAAVDTFLGRSSDASISQSPRHEPVEDSPGNALRK